MLIRFGENFGHIVRGYEYDNLTLQKIFCYHIDLGFDLLLIINDFMIFFNLFEQEVREILFDLKNIIDVCS